MHAFLLSRSNLLKEFAKAASKNTDMSKMRINKEEIYARGMIMQQTKTDTTMPRQRWLNNSLW